ncbi:heterokaryon incompatibility protein-domain-containing protein [Annulohypoxylon truncatum]|uniref:heterokaryon incompatibility protein-domain-containing protein n=1 Tax=Annulohypoxylon truncatum TaxID=327061 RepID=UPI0020072CD0|nr:heterokaryon incompatibility protein-domain-containing protein [Annulohypoxylon truncatum]KAI1206225.1 heterokaryon incompatibility protein-domain-containing protein [Annulohypoxylon truncatum]
MAPLNQDPHYQHDNLFQAQMNKPLIPPTSELKLADLCAKCSGALFHDGHGGFKEKLDDNQSPRLLFPVKSYHENYRKIWTDSIPSLPRIEKSALGGCDFCLFLHNSILSRDVDNMLVQSIGKKQAELGTQKISISVAYCWSSGSPDIYRDLYGGDTVEKEVCSRQDIFSAEDDECEEYHLDDAEYLPTEGENLGKGHDSVETETGIKLDDGQLEGLLIRLESRATGEYIPPFYLCCYATQTPGSEVAGNWLGLALPSSQDYSEPHRAEWMKQALRKCEAHNHELTDEHFAPERLIDVSSPKPRLVLRGKYQMSQTNPYVPTYAALSYCWGPPEDARLQLTTTKETFEKRRRGIENHEMTQVLKDAVFIARELGMPYLWIDALCITQGDTGDWEKQSVDMSKIYGNPKVTLCAASSMSCRESFLRQRGSRIRMPFRSTLQPSITGSFDVQFKYVRMATNGSRIFSHRGMDVFDLDLSQANWSGRGWVFQERFSSRCKLSFGNAFIHYLCDKGSQRMAKSLIDGPWFMSLSATLDGDSEELYHS